MSDGAKKGNSKVKYTNILNDIHGAERSIPYRVTLLSNLFQKKKSCVWSFHLLNSKTILYQQPFSTL